MGRPAPAPVRGRSKTAAASHPFFSPHP
ncbi:hypothetical protein F9K50_04310 [bacterium]|nr:MAG: hypothetical protein F9K50_04310 [bacterium]